MSDEIKNGKSNAQINPEKHSIWPRLGVYTLIVAAVGLAFQMTMTSKTAKIDLLQYKLDECKDSLSLAQTRLASLGYATESESTVVLCPKDAATFFDGGIVVVFYGMEGPDPGYPGFQISDITTGKKDWFIAEAEGYFFEFKHGEEKCVLYFLGFEKKRSEDCARISVGKKQ